MFGDEEKSELPAASPTRFPATELTARMQEGKLTHLVLLNQSTETKLVPVSQTDKPAAKLARVQGCR